MQLSVKYITRVGKEDVLRPVYIETLLRVTHDCDWKIRITYWSTETVNGMGDRNFFRDQSDGISRLAYADEWQ